MIHLDGIEWAVFRAESTIHADVSIDEKLSRLGYRPSGGWVTASYDPDALWRANLGTNTAGRATDFLLPIFTLIVNEEWNISEFLRDRQFLLRILNGENASRILTGSVGDPFS
jgi:hypothetical protein